MSETETELDVLFPEIRQVEMGDGSAVAIPVLVMSQLPGFSKAITPAIATIRAAGIHAAVEGHYEGLRRAVSIATGLTEAQIDGMTLDVFLRLFTAVLEVNLDFFSRRVAPELMQMARVMGPIFGAPATATVAPGSPSAPGSPAGDGATPTSAA